MSTCRPVTHPRRSTLWPECFLYFAASTCQAVDISHIPEGQHFNHNISYMSLPQNVDLSHIPDSWHFDLNVFCMSLHQYVDLSQSQKVDTFTRMFPALHCLNILTCRPVTHPRRSPLWSECFLHFTASTCWPVTHPRRSTLWPKCFPHFWSLFALNLGVWIHQLYHTPQMFHFYWNYLFRREGNSEVVLTKFCIKTYKNVTL